jgi:flagellar protein FliS
VSQNNLARYQAVQIRTSSPGETLIALYDGLFRFLNVARHCMTTNKRAQASEAISRAYAIVSEFYVSLDHNAYPELCANLASLYDFSMHKLTLAQRKGEVESIEEVVRALSPLREAFTTVVRQQAAQAAHASGAEAVAGSAR